MTIFKKISNKHTVGGFRTYGSHHVNPCVTPQTPLFLLQLWTILSIHPSRPHPDVPSPFPFPSPVSSRVRTKEDLGPPKNSLFPLPSSLVSSPNPKASVSRLVVGWTKGWRGGWRGWGSRLEYVLFFRGGGFFGFFEVLFGKEEGYRKTRLFFRRIYENRGTVQ